MCGKNKQAERRGRRKERRIDVSNVYFSRFRARALKLFHKGGRRTALLCVLGDPACEMSQSFYSTGHHHDGSVLLHFWIAAVFARVVVLSRVSLDEYGIGTTSKNSAPGRLTRLALHQEIRMNPYL